MSARFISLFCLIGNAALATAAQGVYKCHPQKTDDKVEIGSLTIDFDHLKVKASKRTYNMGGETMDIQRVGTKKDVEVYRGTNDGDDVLTFYVPTNMAGEVILDWHTSGDGDPVNARFHLICAE